MTATATTAPRTKAEPPFTLRDTQPYNRPSTNHVPGASSSIADSSRLKSEDYRDHTVYMDSEEDVDLDNNEGIMTSNDNKNNYNGITMQMHEVMPRQMQGQDGCIELRHGSEGLERLHNTYGNENEANDFEPGKPQLESGSRKVRIYD